MKRFDFRHLGGAFERDLSAALDGLESGDAALILIHISNTKEGFGRIETARNVIESTGAELLNSVRFNEVDWTMLVRK